MRRGARRLRIGIGALGCGAWSWAQAVALPGPRVVPQGLDDYAKAAQIVEMRDNLNPLADDPKFSKAGDKKVLDRVGGDIAVALSANLWAWRQKRDINGKRVDFLLPTAEDFQGVTQASLLEPGKPVVLAPTGDDALSLQEAAPPAWESQLPGQPADKAAFVLDGASRSALGFMYCNSGQYAACARFVLDRIMDIKGLLREDPGGMTEWARRGLRTVWV